MSINYTCKENVLILISLLKDYGIKRVIISPGTTNILFAASIQHDNWFDVYSAPDERSAAYIACGMAEESGEPVVISCTGATASRNYMSGLTEAYYRRLPILVVTLLNREAIPGQLIPQVIDMTATPKDILRLSTTLPEIRDSDDERKCILSANQALTALTRNGGGPVHVNLIANFSCDFSVRELPKVRMIKRVSPFDCFPPIKEKRNVAIYIGSHSKWKQEQIDIIEKFCLMYNAVVFCDNTSNYTGEHKVVYALVASQEQLKKDTIVVDLMIDLGEVSGDYFTLPVNEVWRVSESETIQDRFSRLSYFFEMPEQYFFEKYVEAANMERSGNSCDSFLKSCKARYMEIYNSIPELPFSNIWIAKHLSPMIPQNSVIHFGILNSLRSWNFFNLPNGVCSNSNVGGFGIDGGLSSLIGASLANIDKLYFGVIGDLAFFYDMNSLGNRHIKNNIRILLINNGKGTEFCNYSHPATLFGEEADVFIAASGHYGSKSKSLVRHYAEDLGFDYFQASSKEEFLSVCDEFVSGENRSKSVIFEVFTESKLESEALQKIRNVVQDYSLKQKVKNAVGVQNIQRVRNLLGR